MSLNLDSNLLIATYSLILYSIVYDCNCDTTRIVREKFKLCTMFLLPPDPD